MKDPKKITLLDIVKTIDGDDIFTNCIIHNGPATVLTERKRSCPLHE